MPESRPKQLRTYPTVRPDSSVIDYRWPDDDVPAELVAPLSKLLGRIGRLGHPSTFVHCELTLVSDEAIGDADGGDVIGTESRTQFVPDAEGEYVLRVQAPDLLEELEIEFEAHQGRAPRTLPHGSAAYRWSDDRSAPEPAPATWERAGDQWLIMEVDRRPVRERWQRPGSQPALNVSRTAELTRAVRGALLRFCADPIPPVLSGHRGDQPNDDPHAMFLALPNAGSAAQRRQPRCGGSCHSGCNRVGGCQRHRAGGASLVRIGWRDMVRQSSTPGPSTSVRLGDIELRHKAIHHHPGLLGSAEQNVDVRHTDRVGPIPPSHAR